MVFLKSALTALVLAPQRHPAQLPRWRWVPLWRWLAKAVFGVLGVLLLGFEARADSFDEYTVKAAYLYNFAKFVEWPPQAFPAVNAPLLICIAGQSPFGDALAVLAGKTVESRPVEVRYFPALTNLERCHIVFIGRAEQGQFKAILAQCGGRPILTVSDIGQFAQMGGMVGLIESEQRIRFAINLVAAQQSGLNLSSQLLKLAIVVIKNGEGH